MQRMGPLFVIWEIQKCLVCALLEGRRGGDLTKWTVCSLVKMLTFMHEPLLLLFIGLVK